MSVKLDIKLDNERVVRKFLIDKGNSLKDFKKELRESTDFIKTFSSNDVFKSKGRVLGEPWVRRKKAYSWQLMQRSGKLRQGFKTKVSRLEGVVFNPVSYFKYHQSKAPRFRLPRRVMLKLTSQLVNDIIKIFHNGLNKKLKK